MRAQEVGILALIGAFAAVTLSWAAPAATAAGSSIPIPTRKVLDQYPSNIFALVKKSPSLPVFLGLFGAIGFSSLVILASHLRSRTETLDKTKGELPGLDLSPVQSLCLPGPRNDIYLVARKVSIDESEATWSSDSSSPRAERHLEDVTSPLDDDMRQPRADLGALTKLKPSKSAVTYAFPTSPESSAELKGSASTIRSPEITVG